MVQFVAPRQEGQGGGEAGREGRSRGLDYTFPGHTPATPPPRPQLLTAHSAMNLAVDDFTEGYSVPSRALILDT